MTIQQQLESGVSHHQAGRFGEAEAIYRQILLKDPNHVPAMILLGALDVQVGRLDAGIELLRRAIRCEPRYADAHFNLGIGLQAKRQPDDAINAYRQAISLRPEFPEAHNRLGMALKDKGQLDEAIACFQKAIQLNPSHAEAHFNRGIAMQGERQFDEAVAAFRRAIELRPDWAEACVNLGNALIGSGQIAEAIDAFRQAVVLQPDNAAAHSSLVLTLNYQPSADAGMIRDELSRWNQRHADPMKKFILPHRNDRDPDRRLRIGYVSQDFCQHVVGRNILPLLSRHDRGRFEIFCYSNVISADGITERFRGCADVWRSIIELSDSEAAELIRGDQIDILVDLSLHTAGNRLGIFARKPAPVQATFAGYPGSTGLDTIDYRLTDPHLDPPGVNDQFYSEKSYRLSDSFWCFYPLVAEIPINAPPAQSRGVVTFGCLNNFCKVNEQVVQLWAEVLKTVAGSRLLLMSPEGSSRERVLGQLRGEGIEPERVEFVSKQSRVEYLRTYNRIDIVLDTFPYNGHTTSLDSFWMGVPVITLVGQTVVGRGGFSQLTNLGLPELIARSPEEYVGIAARLAGDRERLAHLRSTLRTRMSESPLMDDVAYARSVENAFRDMWREWCSKGYLDSSDSR